MASPDASAGVGVVAQRSPAVELFFCFVDFRIFFFLPESAERRFWRIDSAICCPPRFDAAPARGENYSRLGNLSVQPVDSRVAEYNSLFHPVRGYCFLYRHPAGRPVKPVSWGDDSRAVAEGCKGDVARGHGSAAPAAQHGRGPSHPPALEQVDGGWGHIPHGPLAERADPSRHCLPDSSLRR